jgi:thiol-disulfide isomerase/thioredoxin
MPTTRFAFTLLLGATLAAAAVTATAGTPSAAPTAPAPPAGERPAIPALSPTELDRALASRRWLIVEFGGEHCIPCRAMQPILQDLQVALGSKAKVHNFWIQEHPDVARRFKIMVMPTQVVFNPKG